MKIEYAFYVYIMASESGTLYVGMTNDIDRRVSEHQSGEKEGFTKWYACTKLVYVEFHEYVLNAIQREKELKRFTRQEKEELIRTQNPHWDDLTHEWCR
jgi:putative endonuclease